MTTDPKPTPTIQERLEHLRKLMEGRKYDAPSGMTRALTTVEASVMHLTTIVAELAREVERMKEVRP